MLGGGTLRDLPAWRRERAGLKARAIALLTSTLPLALF